MINKSLFSSNRQDWKTPKAVYDGLNKEFNFDFDPCPPVYLEDGLQRSWGCANFCNPPYGRKITGLWVSKGIYEWVTRDATVVFLLPSRTDTKWFHKLLKVEAEFRFIKGRLKFDDQKNGAPFPSVIVVLRGKNHTLVSVKVAQEPHALQDGRFDSSTSEFPQEIKVFNIDKETPGGRNISNGKKEKE